uniref:Uncharacterized protein n=1 Tax=Globodera rostochiensis TaxID=31243 RepID=A0A914HGK1_GLORO
MNNPPERTSSQTSTCSRRFVALMKPLLLTYCESLVVTLKRQFTNIFLLEKIPKSFRMRTMKCRNLEDVLLLVLNRTRHCHLCLRSLCHLPGHNGFKELW